MSQSILLSANKSSQASADGPARRAASRHRWQWVTLSDPWPATHDYSRVTSPDFCSFQSGPLRGSALKIKHHHCHKILRRNNWIKLTLSLKLCRKSLQCLKKTWSWAKRTRVLTHVTHSDLLTHLTRDPLTHCHLCLTHGALYSVDRGGRLVRKTV